MALYAVTDAGRNVRLAQYIYAGLYLSNLLLVFNIYRRLNKVGTILPTRYRSYIYTDIAIVRTRPSHKIGWIRWHNVYHCTRLRPVLGLLLERRVGLITYNTVIGRNLSLAVSEGSRQKYEYNAGISKLNVLL